MGDKASKRNSDYLHYQEDKKSSKVDLSDLLKRIEDQKISDKKKNLIAITAIFLLAIIHTFMANKLTAKAHLIHEEHDERMKKEGASEEEIKHDIPL